MLANMKLKQDGFGIIEVLIILAAVIIIIGGGVTVYLQHRHKQTNIFSSADSGCVNYEVPGSIELATKSDVTSAQITMIIRPIKGHLVKAFPDIGVYYVAVSPGQEKPAIKYLQTQPDIESAAPEGCGYTTT